MNSSSNFALDAAVTMLNSPKSSSKRLDKTFRLCLHLRAIKESSGGFQGCKRHRVRLRYVAEPKYHSASAEASRCCFGKTFARLSGRAIDIYEGDRAIIEESFKQFSQQVPDQARPGIQAGGTELAVRMNMSLSTVAKSLYMCLAGSMLGMLGRNGGRCDRNRRRKVAFPAYCFSRFRTPPKPVDLLAFVVFRSPPYRLGRRKGSSSHAFGPSQASRSWSGTVQDVTQGQGSMVTACPESRS